MPSPCPYCGSQTCDSGPACPARVDAFGREHGDDGDDDGCPMGVCDGDGYYWDTTDPINDGPDGILRECPYCQPEPVIEIVPPPTSPAPGHGE